MEHSNGRTAPAVSRLPSMSIQNSRVWREGSVLALGLPRVFRGLLTVMVIIIAPRHGLAGDSMARIVRIPGSEIRRYEDGRPSVALRLEVVDAGVVLRHGKAPGDCDRWGARDVWVYPADGRFIMHYDGAGPRGWLICRAESRNLTDWVAMPGTGLELGPAGSHDSASASYGTTYFDGNKWHMFYLGTPYVTPGPYYVPASEYLTMKAEAPSADGPWTKRYDIAPLVLEPGTYHAATASPGVVIKVGPEYRMIFSAGTSAPAVRRTLGYARTRDLDGPWQADEKPILPLTEQIENASVFFQAANHTWFLFTNHVGISSGLEYTDAVWVYWTKDIDHWDPKNKAVALDSRSAGWTPYIVGLPSVVPFGNKLALFYDGRSAPETPVELSMNGRYSEHMFRDIALAWIDLPIATP